jgi:hypothetical protein
MDWRCRITTLQGNDLQEILRYLLHVRVVLDQHLADLMYEVERSRMQSLSIAELEGLNIVDLYILHN